MAALSRLRVITHPAGTGSRDESVPQQPRTAAPARRDFFNTQGRYRNHFSQGRKIALRDSNNLPPVKKWRTHEGASIALV